MNGFRTPGNGEEAAPRQLSEALARLAAAPHPPTATAGEYQIPWSDPEFSRRMLQVHLDPHTHMASRRPEVIEQHVRWLADQLSAVLSAGLSGQGRSPGQTHILDVACGPGLYLHRLAALGFQTTGFDFSAVPLQWARRTAAARGLDCRFLELDLTRLPEDLPEEIGPVDAVTFWFGEFNSFDREQAAAFLPVLARCLRPGGLFFLEYQPLDLFVQEDDTRWSFCESSVFSDRPHFWLEEFAWDPGLMTEVHVHWILEADSGKLDRYVQRHVGWTDAQLCDLLAEAGLTEPVFHPPITGTSEQFEFPLVVTRRKEA